MTLQPLAPGAVLRCPVCTVEMTYVAKWHMWRCPVPHCRIEVWPPVVESADEQEYQTVAEMFKGVSRPPGGLIRKGSKEGVGRKRKKPRKQRRDDDLEK